MNIINTIYSSDEMRAVAGKLLKLFLVWENRTSKGPLNLTTANLMSLFMIELFSMTFQCEHETFVINLKYCHQRSIKKHHTLFTHFKHPFCDNKRKNKVITFLFKSAFVKINYHELKHQVAILARCNLSPYAFLLLYF